MKCAYVTLLYGDNMYFIGTLVFILSLIKTKPKYDLLLLYTEDVPINKLDILRKYYTKVIKIDYIKINKIERKRFIDVYTKLQIFKLTEYDKILFMDNDMLVQKNIDHLFEYSTPAGMALSENLKYKDKEKITDKNIVFNAGLWLLKPSLTDFKKMIKGLEVFDSSYELEQEYVSYYYNGKWTNISYLYNFQFTLRTLTKTPIRSNIYSKINSKDVYVIHYSSPTKPWNMIIEPEKIKKNPIFIKNKEYYGIWFKYFMLIYKSYINKDIDLLFPYSILTKFSGKELTNKINIKINECFGNNGKNYELFGKNIYNYYLNIKNTKNYKFYIIPGLSSKINSLLIKKLPNIDSTYNEMFDELYKISKKIFIVGGAIRDSFLNRKPKDIDISFDSTYKDVIKLCKKNEWACPEVYERGFPYVVFGTKKGKTLEATYKSSPVFDKKNIERDYTINNMVYDIKNKILIDITGNGLNDILNKKIRIPVPKSQYLKWANERWKHPLRYFKLIQNGLTPYDNDTEKFIINYIESHFESIYLKPNKNIPTIKYYLIVSITGGKVYDNGTYIYGNNKSKLIPYLNTLEQYLKKDIIMKILELMI